MVTRIDRPTTTIPLWTDENGSIRVGDTRVLLELVIQRFNEGDSPEGIVESYPTLKLSDVYLVTAYYLAHRVEIDAYIKSVDEDSERIRLDHETKRTPANTAWRASLRERLIQAEHQKRS